MKKNRTNLAAACLATALVLASCSTEELMNMNTEPDNNGSGLQTITASTGTDGTDTRVAYEEDNRVSGDGTKGITVKWEYYDGIKLILKDAKNNTTSDYIYTGRTSAASGSFDLAYGSTALGDGEFYAFYGMNNDISYNASDGISYQMWSTNNKNQYAEYPMDHLPQNNAMTADGTCKDGSATRITFKSLMAMVSLKITLPNGKTPSKVWIYSPDKKLVSNRKCKASTGETIGTDSKTNALNLTIKEETASSFTAHYLLVPSDLSTEDLYLIVQSGDGGYYCSGAFQGANFQPGKRYTKAIEVKAAVSGGDGTSDSPWTISDAATLRAFSLASHVAGSNMRGKYIRLEQDIDLEGKEFMPISGRGGIYFDGNSKTISGLKVSGTSNNAGLIGSLEGGSIKDLTVSGEVSGGIAGGIVGKVQDTTLEGTLVSRVTVNGKSYAGGIAGYAVSMTLADGLSLSHEGPVAARGKQSYAYAGGLFGQLSVSSWGVNTTLSNSGSVEGTSTGNGYEACAGGFIGDYANETIPSYITGTCSGTVTATADTDMYYYSIAAWAGWKVGRCDGTKLTERETNTAAANTGYDEANPRPTVTAKNNKTGGKAYVNGVEQ